MWTCKHCTFDNNESFKSCEMCLRPRRFELPNLTSLNIPSSSPTEQLCFKDDHFASKKEVKDKPVSPSAVQPEQTKSTRFPASHKVSNRKKTNKMKSIDIPPSPSSVRKVARVPSTSSSSGKSGNGTPPSRPKSYYQATVLHSPCTPTRIEIPPQNADGGAVEQTETNNGSLNDWEENRQPVNQHPQSTSEMFEDSQFPPSQASIGNCRSRQKINSKIIWIRLEEFFNKENDGDQRILREDFKPSDVVQGYLGNCWFVSVLSLLADHLDVLNEVMETKVISEIGAYQFRLFVAGKWKSILIDSYVPCTEDRQIAFTRGKRNQLFVPLIEKALAKIHGSYEALESGLGIEALSNMTGMPCRPIQLQVDVNGRIDEDVWVRLESAHNANYLLVTSCGLRVDSNAVKLKYTSVGLRFKHVYSIHDVQSVVRDDNGQPEYLVQLRNPWGEWIWVGHWSTCSDQWQRNPSLKECLLAPSSGGGDGVFWMAFKDMKKYFQRVDLCMVDRKWQYNYFDGVFPEGATASDDISACSVLLELRETSEVEFSLFQHAHRKSTAKVDCCLVVIESGKPTSKGKYPLKKVKAMTKRNITLQVGCGCVLDAGVYIVAGLAFNHWSLNKESAIPNLRASQHPFTITIHSRKEVALTYGQVKLPISHLIYRMARDNGKIIEMDWMEYDVEVFSLTQHGGPILVAANSNPTSSVYVRSFFTKSEEFACTRGPNEVVDLIPPNHFQVLGMLSRKCKINEVELNFGVKIKLHKKPDSWKPLTPVKFHPNLFKPQPLSIFEE